MKPTKIDPDANSGLRIDGHAHAFLASLPMAGGRRYAPNDDARLETYLDLLVASGFDGAMLVQPSFLGTDNSFLLEALTKARRNPGGPILKGVAVLDCSAALEDMQTLKGAGVVGVRLNFFARPIPDLTSKSWSDFFDRIEDVGWHVELHLEGARLTKVLEQLCAKVSKVVVDHFGLPDAGLSPSLLAPPHNGVYVKCSAPYRVFPDLPLGLAIENCTQIASQLLDARGPERLIWGSDWPWTQHAKGQTYADTVSWIELWAGSSDISTLWYNSLLGGK
jgi:predicted TIM-barrel fold metal-dependent hydrolase